MNLMTRSSADSSLPRPIFRSDDQMSAPFRRGGIRQAVRRAKVSYCIPTHCGLKLTPRYFADNIRDDYANGALDGQVEAALEEMRELSIYGP